MNPFKTVSFYTLGCKLNFSESSEISKTFTNAGYTVTSNDQASDIVVINTCSVTENADKKCRQIVRRCLKKNPTTYIIVIGCYAQLKPKEIESIPGVNLVLGANTKFDIVALFEEHQNQANTQVYNTKINTLNTFVPSYSTAERTRSFLKIQDGCDYFCSFCTIPLARGKSRNGSISSIIEKVHEIALQNIKEIVLTGVNIGDFGQGKSKETFLELIKALDTCNNKIRRYRISSIEPNLLSHEIINFVSHSKSFMPHFHIPLQSGEDAILKKMRRKYNTSLFKDRVLKIKSVMPHACIGADVIVGFPEETEESFMATVNFIKRLPLSYLHVFTYSERAHTTAAKSNKQIPIYIRKKRSKILRLLSEKLSLNFYKQFLGTSRSVLFEGQKEDTLIYGFTDNYIKVAHPYSPALSNIVKTGKLNTISKKKYVTLDI